MILQLQNEKMLIFSRFRLSIFLRSLFRPLFVLSYRPIFTIYECLGQRVVASSPNTYRHPSMSQIRHMKHVLPYFPTTLKRCISKPFNWIYRMMVGLRHDQSGRVFEGRKCLAQPRWNERRAAQVACFCDHDPFSYLYFIL